MKHMLDSWHSVTEQEYPHYVNIIPHPYEIYPAKIENCGVMTDTFKSAQNANQLTAASINGVIHSMFCIYHLRNVWVNNVLDSLNEFLRAHLNVSLDEVAP